jgi:hypothetical protein
MHFVKNNQVYRKDLKEKYAMEIQLKDWRVRKDTNILNADDRPFQLAFRKI